MANPDGTPIWFELITDDADAAESFYGKLIGWTFARPPGGLDRDYRVFSASGQGVGGVMKAENAEMPHGWLLYFGAADVDAAADRVKALGGTVHIAPTDIPNVGRFAYVADPQGVGFYLMRGDSPEDSTAFKLGPGNSGHGVWIELATPNPDAAFGFYGKLFGWTKQGAMPMGDMGEYAFLGAGEARPGAVMSSATTGAPPRWKVYFNVPDIDSTIATAAANGGRLLQGPDEIPGGDFSANIADSQGAAVGLVGARKKGD